MIMMTQLLFGRSWHRFKANHSKTIFAPSLSGSNNHMKASQDRSPFYIFHIMNEIWLHLELINTFTVEIIAKMFKEIIQLHEVNI